jgi:hypothetical protein
VELLFSSSTNTCVLLCGPSSAGTGGHKAVQGSSMFYISGRPSTAVWMWHWAIAFCQRLCDSSAKWNISHLEYHVVSLISGQHPSQWCLRLVVQRVGVPQLLLCNAAIFRLHYVTATVRTHNQNQGHAWHDLGALTRSP